MSVLDELVAGALEDQRTRELTVSLEDVKKATLAARLRLTRHDGLSAPTASP